MHPTYREWVTRVGRSSTTFIIVRNIGLMIFRVLGATNRAFCAII